MSDLQITIKQKKIVVESCLRQIYVAIYNATINLRVAKIADDEQMKEAAINSLKKSEKQKDGYEEILQELEELEKDIEEEEKK